MLFGICFVMALKHIYQFISDPESYTMTGIHDINTSGTPWYIKYIHVQIKTKCSVDLLDTVDATLI